MTAEYRRGLALAGIGLVGGIALVVAMFGTGEFLKRQIPHGPGAAPPPGEQAGDEPAGREGPPLAALPADPRKEAGGNPGKPGGAESHAGPAGSSQGQTGPERGEPVLDIVRVEPDGETVVAGRAAPNATIELLRDGRPVTSAQADGSGQFAIVPPALPPGSHEITLRARDKAGQEIAGRQSVAVVIGERRDTRPLIALSDPDKPTQVLSRPDAPDGSAEARRDGRPAAPARTADLPPAASGPAGEAKRGPAGTGGRARPAGEGVKVVAIDAQEGGRLDVSGQTAPDAALRLYLNDTLVASGRADAQGRIAFTIGRGVRPGSYQVRVDQVDAATGKVRERAEVPFVFPGEAGARTAASPPRPSQGRIVAELPANGTPPGRIAGGIVGRAPGKGADGTGGASLEAPSGTPGKTTQAPGKTGQASAQPGGETGREAGPGLAWAETRNGSGPSRPAPAGARGSRQGDAPANAVPPASEDPAAGSPGAVFVAEISTARIVRGDSLWQISRRTYGRGNRYTVIYDANQDQIRDPNRIYPGQMFVLPQDGAPDASGRPSKRG